MSQGTGEKGRLVIDYTAPGPVCAAYVRSRAPVKIIIGPAGSGKTTGALHDALMCGIHQPPSPIDGVRRYKIGVARDTYRRLWDTTIPSWLERVPQTYGSWTGGKDQPATHVLPIVSGGDRWEIIFEFVALGEQGYEASLRGMQVSRWLLEELDTMPVGVLAFCLQRAGRYPHADHGFAHYAGVGATSNAFDVDSDHYQLLVENRPEGWELHRQPSGLSPQAENINKLRGGQDYYRQMMKGADPLFVQKYVHAEWGYSRDGQPVYPEFEDRVHIAAEPLRPMEELALVIGADAGLTPACVILQQAATGQWLVLDEIAFVGGAEGFAAALNRLLARPDYRRVIEAHRVPGGTDEWTTEGPGLLVPPGHSRSAPTPAGVSGWCDPTAFARVQTDERTWAQVVSRQTGIRFRPAPSNLPGDRLEAVRRALRPGGMTPPMLVSPTCKVLRRGFNSSYRYAVKRITGGSLQRGDRPEKNHPFSDIHDALQYAILGGGEYMDVQARQSRRAMAAPLQVITGR